MPRKSGLTPFRKTKIPLSTSDFKLGKLTTVKRIRFDETEYHEQLNAIRQYETKTKNIRSYQVLVYGVDERDPKRELVLTATKLTHPSFYDKSNAKNFEEYDSNEYERIVNMVSEYMYFIPRYIEFTIVRLKDKAEITDAQRIANAKKQAIGRAAAKLKREREAKEKRRIKTNLTRAVNALLRKQGLMEPARKRKKK
jgi:hypothetical protein